MFSYLMLQSNVRMFDWSASHSLCYSTDKIWCVGLHASRQPTDNAQWLERTQKLNEEVASNCLIQSNEKKRQGDKLFIDISFTMFGSEVHATASLESHQPVTNSHSYLKEIDSCQCDNACAFKNAFEQRVKSHRLSDSFMIDHSDGLRLFSIGHHDYIFLF